jgi:hypothetical protein
MNYKRKFYIKIPTPPQQEKNKFLTTIFLNYVLVHNSSHYTVSTKAAFQTDGTRGDIRRELHHAVLSTTNVTPADHLILRLITLLNYVLITK